MLSINKLVQCYGAVLIFFSVDFRGFCPLMMYNISFLPDITWSATLLLYDWEQKPGGNLGFKYSFLTSSSCSTDPHVLTTAGHV